MMAFPGLDRLTRLIPMTRTKIIKIDASPSSNGGFSIFVMTLVDVVEAWARVVMDEIVCSVVLVLVKVLRIVALPVSVTTNIGRVVLVISVVVVVLIVEV
jgi:nucleoside recognition membrane protein YjiH